MIVFISNYLNHHQLSFCTELAKRDKFYFVATMPTPGTRLTLGYRDMNNEFDFVVRTYESKESKAFAQNLLDTADVVVAGSCAFPFEMLVPRLESDKLTFWFSERLFKISGLELFYPPKLKRVLSQCTKYRKNKNFYLLCAGGYVANDYRQYNAFKGKCFSWGYFPESIVKSESELRDKKVGDKVRILWTARYLKLKRPGLVIRAAELLNKADVDFEIKMIGNGILYDKIADEIKSKKLENRIVQTGALPYDQVRDEMDNADVFLFTSTRREGWGAVLNESMNSGCAVIADKRIGAAKSLIQDGKNGLLFSSRKQFEKTLIKLVKDKEKIRSLGMNAYHTIVGLWNAELAVDRFVSVANAVLSGRDIPEFDVGPMSHVC